MLVDDDIDILELLQRHLKSMDYHTYKAVSVKEALYILKDTEIDLLVTDINMPEIDGLELVKYVAEHYPNMPKLVVTGFPSVEDASSVIKHGATDYLTKPFTKMELDGAVKKALASKEAKDTFKTSPVKPMATNGYADMIGNSEAFQKVTEIIDRVRDNRATVLVRGESGTGKELVARAIHYSGKFARAPFIAVNCGAIPENLLEAELFGYTKGAFTGANENRNGFFQAAHKGTIFLDEIGNATLPVQNRLLRVLQEKEVTKIGSQKPEKLDVRVIAATNSDLEELIQKKHLGKTSITVFPWLQLMCPPSGNVPPTFLCWSTSLCRSMALSTKIVLFALLMTPLTFWNDILGQAISANWKMLCNAP